mmetsp:Transcript_21093/g.29783  ORF Transcript_21093/g.29783 Transcript_21093/m.29783 type:complete len:921 (-) Transcript_21093:37-2799(-)
MPNHSHRAGGLRQSNKRNKRSKASKRSVNRVQGGKVEGGGARGRGGIKNAIAQSRADRRHMASQRRNTKRQELMRKKRQGITDNSRGGMNPPRLVGIISLGESEHTEEQLRTLLLKDADKVIYNNNEENGDEKNALTATAKYEVHKKDGILTYITGSTAFRSHYGKGDDNAIMAALDMCRVCDTILFVIDGNGPEGDQQDVLGMHIGGNDDPSVSTKGTTKTTLGRDWEHLISERGDRILAAIKAQGLPTPLTILAHTMKEEMDAEDFMTAKSAKSVRRGALKRRLDLKRYVGRFATSEFGDGHDKVMEVDLSVLKDEDTMLDQDEVTATTYSSQSPSAALVRTICNMSASPPKWVADSSRSYILSEGCKYDKEKEELQISGFVRGSGPFDVNSLIHIPNLGTHAIKFVQKAPHGMMRRHGKAAAEMVESKDKLDVCWSEPANRESLEMMATPDALEGEQNLIGFDDDIPEEDSIGNDLEKGAQRPAGWSDYQSAWLDAVDQDNLDADDTDYGELAKALNQKSSAASVGGMDLEEDMEISAEERKALLEQRRKDQKEDLEFPDEVEVNEDEKASDRFARYRSLKSFRKSFWDPKENLPDSYASIYHFASFKATQRDVMADMKDVAKAADECNGDFWGGDPRINGDNQQMADDSEEDEDILEGCIPSGTYVCVTIEKVSTTAYARLSPDSLVTAVTLLPHENKVSVLHMGLSQSSKCDRSEVPVKSKDVLTFRCGWRTWQARPVFSQNNLNSDKHKFERYMPQDGAFFAASIFGPVTYSPCPVIVFRESVSEDNVPNRELIAIGSMLGADADRIVVKRIILTGYPTRVHKRHATVKYMFYNPDDVNWFKPAGLTTKHGLNGNIIESVGEHGTMKCLFNAPIKQHDTVCLPLYKRIYPKFAPFTKSPDENETVSNSTSLLVL